MKTMYFIGVSTTASAIHRIFPVWARLAGIGDAALVATDIALDATREVYRGTLQRIYNDPAACGALVTSHKVQVFRHGHDLFTQLDPDSKLLQEVSCIVRRPGVFEGRAIDTLTSGLGLRAILSEPPFRGVALIMGAGGAGTALAVQLLREHRPAELILTDISSARLQEVQTVLQVRCELVSGPLDHDRLLKSLPAGSLVVNATGVGKDRPGAPITPDACFPDGAIAWEFNYRGDLRFLDYARKAGVRAYDGWDLFLHGWSQIMAHVFDFALTPGLFAEMEKVALGLRP